MPSQRSPLNTEPPTNTTLLRSIQTAETWPQDIYPRDALFRLKALVNEIAELDAARLKSAGLHVAEGLEYYRLVQYESITAPKNELANLREFIAFKQELRSGSVFVKWKPVWLPVPILRLRPDHLRLLGDFLDWPEKFMLTRTCKLFALHWMPEVVRSMRTRSRPSHEAWLFSGQLLQTVTKYRYCGPVGRFVRHVRYANDCLLKRNIQDQDHIWANHFSPQPDYLNLRFGLHLFHYLFHSEPHLCKMQLTGPPSPAIILSLAIHKKEHLRTVIAESEVSNKYGVCLADVIVAAMAMELEFEEDDNLLLGIKIEDAVCPTDQEIGALDAMGGKWLPPFKIA